MSRQERVVALLLFLIDALVIIAALAAAFAWRYGGRFLNDPPSQPTNDTVFFAGVMLAIVLALFIANHCYDPEMLFGGHREYAAIVKATTYGAGVTIILAFLADQPISRGALVLAWLVTMPFVCLSRFLVRRIIFRLRESGRFMRRWLIVGTGAHAVAVARQLSWPASAGTRVVGFLDDYRPVGAHVADGLRVLGDPRAVRKVVQEHGVSTIVVVPQAVSWESYRDLLELASGRDGVRMKLAPGLQHLVTTGAEMTDRGFLPLISLQPLRITGVDALMKRTFDYAASLPLLALLAPFALLCWLASRVDGDGPLLVRQPVLGQQRERFSLVTFALPSGPVPQAWLPRCAWRYRRLMERSRLGKLPNIVNVFAGHMSVVGPRAVPANGKAVSEGQGDMDEPWLRNLLRVRPGLTGPAVDVTRGEGPEEQALKDIGYVRDYSLWLDLRLIFASLKRVLRRQRSLPSSYGLIKTQKSTSPATPGIAERLP